MKDFEQRVRERMPSPEEERAVLGRVWNHVARAGGQIPDDMLRSVQQRPRGDRRAWTFVPKAVAAVLVVGAVVGAAIVWPRGVRVYAAGNDGLQVTLADDSRVEMRAHAEMTVGRAADGIQIDLKKGDIIVTAAKQRRGQLSVQTKDMTVAVEGTVFLAEAGQQGSRVAVIEGEVLVQDGKVETKLRPGQQLATSATISQRPLAEDITWSRNKDAHLAILDSFKRAMAKTSGPLSPVVSATERQQGSSPASPAPVEFEEASIRECDPNNVEPPAAGRGGGPNSFYMTPGRTYALCMTAATLIRSAYGYRGWSTNYLESGGRVGRGMSLNNVYATGQEDGLRVRGGPDWVRSTHYTIEAVAGTPADAATMHGPMLRALLEQRFGLKMHIETEQIPAFALTIAPGGLKLKEGQCISADGSPVVGGATADSVRRNLNALPSGGATADSLRRNLNAVRRGETTIEPCSVGLVLNGPNLVYVGAAADLPLLGAILGASVIDRTGIPATARFNYVLEFRSNEMTTGPLARVPNRLQMASDPSAVPPAADLFTALEQQLGLRLEPAQVPREFIVIDHIERPSPN